MAAVGGSATTQGGKDDYTLFATAVVATAGLLVGHHIGISGGLMSTAPFLKKFFPNVYSREAVDVGGTDQYCKFDDTGLSLFTSSLYLAALVTSLFASSIARQYGRKRSMVFAGLLLCAGAVISGYAVNVAMLTAGRILLGFGVGIVYQAAPAYLREMTPYNHRLRRCLDPLSVIFQLYIPIGIHLANVFIAANVGTPLSDQGWLLTWGFAAVLAFIFTAGSLCLPDTPDSLIERGKRSEALAQLRKARGMDDVEDEFKEMVAAASEASKNAWSDLLRRCKYRPQLAVVILIPFFQQLSGMGVFALFAPLLFKAVGFNSMAAFLSTFANFMATFVSIFTVDNFQRRSLYLVGGVQMLFGLIIAAVCVALRYGVDGDLGEQPTTSYAAAVVAAVCVSVAGFAWSWGPLGWLVPDELLPEEVRPAGRSVSASADLLFAFIISQCFLKMLCVMKFGIFVFFSVFVLAMTIFIYFFLPETKGIPMEEVAAAWNSHPYWKRFINQDEDDTVARKKMN